MRNILPPVWVMEILKQRYVDLTSHSVFPTSTGTSRAPDNTRASIRKVVDETPCQGFHRDDFRHYVAGVLDKAGLSAREIADYLGHERISTTKEGYMERGVVGEEAGQALNDRTHPPRRKTRVNRGLTAGGAFQL